MHEKDKKPLVLIVDDNLQNLQLLGEKIDQSGYEAAIAISGSHALDFLKENIPDIILLDIMMPVINGFEVCKRIKNDPKTRDIPVIFLTAKTSYNDISKAFEIGAVDYITKPFNIMELNARIRTHLELKKSKEDLKKYNEKLEKANRDLKEANEIILQKNLELSETLKKLEVAARTDPLTGMLNRRSMLEKIDQEAIRYKRSGKVFSLIMSDIDHFKRINDEHGHDCGDYVLITIANILQSMIREQDSLSRWGGEEFLILLPETSLSGAEILPEKIRNKIEAFKFHYMGIEFTLTMTFGVADYNSSSSIDSIIKNSDIALYEGKRKGRNCVISYSPHYVD